MPPRIARPEVFDVQGSFRGGLNVSAPGILTADNEVRRAENARLDNFGGISKMGGTQYVSASALGGAVTGGESWVPTGTTTRQEVVVANGDVYTGAFSIPMTWTNRGGSLSTTQLASLAAFRDGTTECMYIADGGRLNKWDGTTLTEDIATSPTISKIWVYNRRLLAVGNTSDTQKLYWSALDNGDTLGDNTADGGSAVIRTFGQSSLTTGGAVAGAALLVHVGGISVFEGWSQDDIAIQAGTRGLSNTVGSIAPNSFIVVEGTGYFLSDRGFFSASPIEGVRSISLKIDDYLRPVTSNFGNTAQTCVVGHNSAFREIWWYVSDIGVMVYNYVLGAWTGPRTGLLAEEDTFPRAFWNTRDTSGRAVFMAGSTNGRVYQVDAFDPTTGASAVVDGIDSLGVGGSSITFAVQCRRFYCGSSITRKAFRWVYITASLRGNDMAALTMSTETASATVSIVGSYGGVWDPTQVWDTGLTWTGQGTVLYRVPAGGTGPYIDITIVDDSNQAISSFSRIDLLAFSLGAR